MRTRFVNFLSVGAVMTGVAVMIVVMAVADGFQSKVREVVRGTLSHLSFEPTGNVVFADGTEPPDPSFAELDAILRADPDVAAVAPQVTSFVAHPWVQNQRARATNFFLVQAVGIDWARETGVIAAPKGETEAQKAARLEKERAGAVSQLADYLVAVKNREHPFDDEDARYREFKTAIFGLSFLESFIGTYPEGPSKYLGQRVEVVLFSEKRDAKTGESQYEKAVKQLYVVGVYDTNDSGADKQRIYMAREDLREIANIEPEYQEVRVALKDYDHADAARSRLLARLAVRDPATGAAMNPFSCRTWEDAQRSMIKALNDEKSMLLIVLSFIVILACFTILATLTLTVVEKTRDIGVVRALGGTTGGVLSIFLRSGLLIGTIGGVLGLGLGLYAAYHVNGIKRALSALGLDLLSSEASMFREIPIMIYPWQVASIVGGSIFVSFLAGLLPALRAARMDPVVALRHE